MAARTPPLPEPTMRARRTMLWIALAAVSPGALAAGQRSSASAFVPLVKIVDTVGRCDTSTVGGLEPGERRVLLRFGSDQSAIRVVSVVWDSAGKLVRYSEARGDVRAQQTPPADRGDRTTISIDFAKGMAILMNESHGRSLGAMMVDVNDAFTAERLGSPRSIVERLQRQCR